MPTPSGTPSSSSLRSRKFDFKKPLLVFKLVDLPLADQGAVLNRNIPTFATGVEKEEEEEHHLQAALIASQNNLVGSVVIPTPDASKLFSNYKELYSADFVQPKSFIRFSATIEESRGVPYDADDKDLEFLNLVTEEAADVGLSIEDFEESMWTLEKLGNDKGKIEPSVEECCSVLEALDKNSLNSNTLAQVIQHWKNHRYGVKGGKALIPSLRFEELSDKPDSDPYVCFRRRELKPLRKMRRSDGQALEKLSRLRNELLQAKEILSLVVARENCKREALELDIQIFEERVKIRKLKKKLGIPLSDREWDTAPLVKPRKKLKRSQGSRDSTRIRIPPSKFHDASSMIHDMDMSHHELFLLSLDEKVKKRQLTEEKDGWIDMTENPFIPNNRQTDWFINNNLICEQRNQGSNLYMRNRIGRGGRLIIDRHLSRKRKLHTSGIGSSLIFDCKENLEKYQNNRERQRFDNSSDEFNSDPELIPLDDESQSNFKFRTITVAPKEDEYKYYMNKPTHFEQISIQPNPLGTVFTSGLPPASVVRAVIPAALKKRLSKTSSSMVVGEKTLGVSLKKKSAELSERNATVKAMMQQAQKQAHQTQYQLQLQQQSRLNSNKKLEESIPIQKSTVGMNGTSVPVNESPLPHRTRSGSNGANGK